MKYFLENPEATFSSSGTARWYIATYETPTRYLRKDLTLQTTTYDVKVNEKNTGLFVTQEEAQACKDAYENLTTQKNGSLKTLKGFQWN